MPLQFADLETLDGLLTDSLVTFVVQRLVLACRELGNIPGTVATLSSTLVRDVESARATGTILDPDAHLLNPTIDDLRANYLFAPVHDSIWRHFVLFIFDRQRSGVLALDPLGDDGRSDNPGTSLQQTYERLVACLQHVLHEYSVPQLGHIAFNMSTYVNVFRRNKHTARQEDGISCGVFVLAYIYWYLFHNRNFPTVTDFLAGNHVTARLFPRQLRGPPT